MTTNDKGRLKVLRELRKMLFEIAGSYKDRNRGEHGGKKACAKNCSQQQYWKGVSRELEARLLSTD